MLVSVVLFLTIFGSVSRVAAVTCYKCESHRDYRCADPFDYASFIQYPHPNWFTKSAGIACNKNNIFVLKKGINCDFVGTKKATFCEKKTHIVDGYYVTERGCSSEFSWDDIRQYADQRSGDIPCISRGTKEICLCTGDRCNSATRFINNVQNVPLLILAILFYVNFY